MNTLEWAELEAIAALLESMREELDLEKVRRARSAIERLNDEISAQEQIRDRIVSRITERILEAA